MKYVIAFAAMLLSPSLYASASCVNEAKVAAIQIANMEGLSYVAENIDAEIEGLKFSKNSASYLVKTTFDSMEEHEFMRIEVEVELSSCEIVKANILQDSRKN